MSDILVQDESVETSVDKVSATQVAESERMKCLPRHFGARMMHFENTVYHFMDKLIESYKGAYWEFYELSNGGFYMAPRIDSPVRVKVESNWYEGEISADAAGIIACLFALSHLSFKFRNDERLAEHYHLLLDYAYQHPESSAIASAID